MLDSYIDHIVQSENRSMLVRIYGLYTIQSEYFAPLDLIVMENICRGYNPKSSKQFAFDLKGSVVNRRDPIIKRGKVLKCMNFVDLNSSAKKLVRLDTEQAEYINDTLESDTQFLARMNLMDYSVYLEIEQISQHPASQSRLYAELNRNEFLSYDRTNIYHVGVIDFLEPYSYFK